MRERIPFTQDELTGCMKGSPAGTTFLAIPNEIMDKYFAREISRAEYERYIREECPEGYVVD